MNCSLSLSPKIVDTLTDCIQDLAYAVINYL